MQRQCLPLFNAVTQLQLPFSIPNIQFNYGFQHLVFMYTHWISFNLNSPLSRFFSRFTILFQCVFALHLFRSTPIIYIFTSIILLHTIWSRLWYSAARLHRRHICHWHWAIEPLNIYHRLHIQWLVHIYIHGSKSLDIAVRKIQKKRNDEN